MARRAPLLDPVDVNLVVAGLLADMAAIQTSKPRGYGYEQAAAAIRALDTPLDALVAADGTLPRIPRIGPSSTRIIQEVLAGGASATVERAVDESGKRAEIDRRRGLRRYFLSRAVVRRVLDEAGRYAQRCDLQMHSTWSDGRQSLEEIVAACAARGYTHAAVTDHSAGLPIARGLSADRFAAQAAAIDVLNRQHPAGVRLLKGVEANILADGTLDVPAEERAAFDLVVAAPHSGLRTGEDQTARMVAAVTQPHVHVLGHPLGRKIGVRPGIAADWTEVFAAAAAHGVAVEIDGDPSRQDLDYRLAALADRAGCLIALDSDAHAVAELDYVDTAMAHARLAGISAAHIINTWPYERFADWLRSR